MNYDFYWVSGSTYSWTVMFALEYKGISYRSKRLNPDKNELKSRFYLSLNPWGRVPALVSKDIVLYETIAILAFLDHNHREKPLFGTNAYEYGGVWKRLMEIHNQWYAVIHQDLILSLYRDDREDYKVKIFKSSLECHRFLGWLDGCLEASNFICSDELSAVDLYVLPIVESLDRAVFLSGSKELNINCFEEDYPNIQRWKLYLEQMECFKKSFPPHWQ